MVIDTIFAALEILAQPVNIALIAFATMFGMFVGMIPGIGGLTALSLLIPLSYGLDPITAFMIFTATLGGGNFGGSISAILLNTPGQATNAATLLDGHPMARDGRAGEAIGAAATASAAGAMIGVVLLLVTLPFFLEISLLFGSPQIFWLGVWGITVISVVVSDDILPGLISGLLGLVITFHGVNAITGDIRWTYGLTSMYNGFKLIPALIGLFAVAEMIKLSAQGGRIADAGEDVDVSTGKWKGVKSVFVYRGVFLRAALIGVFIGMIPGVGGTAANYIAYFQTVNSSDDPDSFGNGDIRGVIGSEASNDAKDGGGFLPTLALGVPGSAGMALLLGAFVLHGITPGPLLFQRHTDIVVVIIFSLIISNLLTSSVGLLLVEQLTGITKINIYLIAPIVISVGVLGSYILSGNIFDISITVLFGLLGYVMIKVDMSRVPLILAMVLGPIVEMNLWRSLRIASGDPAIFFRSPVSLILIVLVVLSLFAPLIRKYIARTEVLP